MSEYFEIAYATASKRLCLFTGTGFSKAVTNGKAPSWQELLENICDGCGKCDELKDSLFPEEGSNPLSLEEAAQVIHTQLLSDGKNIHDETACIIDALEVSDGNENIKTFIKENSFITVTTNYDYLLEEIAGHERVDSIVPGLPIPQSDTDVKVYHVHGSIEVPQKMVVTTNDYFEFMGRETYFSRKLSTVLHENTVVILGYSLGDGNLKAIINEHRGFSKTNFTGSNIFMVSRDKINEYVKDYYQDCYGIRVVDGVELDDFFEKLNRELPDAIERKDKSVSTLKRAINEELSYTAKYLKIESSFYEVLLSISALGHSIDEAKITRLLTEIINQKVELTRESGAWDQYEQLARWLVYFASKFEFEKPEIKEVFLEATKHSMDNMSKSLKLGYSWHAYSAWYNKWSGISISNRNLIREYIKNNDPNQDALSVVEKL